MVKKQHSKHILASLIVAFAILNMLIPKYVAAALNGTYTINAALAASSTNYKTFASAVSDLKSGTRADGGTPNGTGVSGAVTFNVANGTYTEQISISAITGASATKRITFQSATGDSSKVILTSSTGTTLDYTLELKQANFITFRKITLSRTGLGTATTTKVIVMDTSSNNQFLNNRIIGGRKPSGSGDFSFNTNVAIHLRGSDTNNLFMNNHIIYGFHGIFINGPSSSNSIIGNIIDSSGGAAIYAHQQTNLLIEKNIARLAWTGTDVPFVAYAVRLESPVSFKILANKFFITSGTGTARAIVIFNSAATTKNPGLIVNNWVSVTGANTGAATGLSLGGGKNINIYHNNFLVSNSSLTGSSVFHFYPTGNGVIDSIRSANNNFIHTGVGYVYDFQQAVTALITSNYNNLFTSGTNFAQIVGATGSPFKTITTYKTASGKETNSINVNPGYVSGINLTPTNYAIQKKGTALGITTDINGKTRPSSNPDIGANQLDIFTRDAGISAINVPSGTSVCAGNNIVNVSLMNFGKDTLRSASIAWSVNGVAQTSFNFTGGKLAIDSLARVNIGSFNFTTGTTILKIWSLNPNSGTDQLASNDTITKSFTVNPAPNAIVGNDTVICLGNSVQIGAASIAGRTYSWTSNPAGFTSTSSSNIVNPTVSTTYYLTERITSTGCTKTDSVVINVNPLPAANVGNDHAICNGAGTQIGAAAVTGNTYSWTSIPAGFTSSVSNPAINPATTTRYILTETTASGCVKKDTVTITVNPLPFANAGTSGTLCIGKSVQLGSTSVAGNTYSWTSSPVGFTSALSNPTVNPVVTTTYILTETVTATACTKTDSVTITVNPLPAANAGQDRMVCNGGSSQIGDSAITGNTYSWTSVPAGFTSAVANPIVNPGVTTTYILTVMSGSSCINTDSVTLTVVPNPSALIQGNPSVCAGSTVTYSTPFVSGITYSWSVTGGTIVSGQNTDSTTIKWSSTDTSGSVQVIATSTLGGCTDTATIAIDIISLPVINWTVTQGSGRTFSFAPSDTTFVSYNWSFGDGDTSSSVNPTHSYLNDSTYTVSLTIRTSEGCEVTKDSVISVTSGITMYTNPLTSINIYPNPFKDVTTLKYTLTEKARIQVSVYDITGREIANLENATQTPGNYQYNFDANKYNANAGVYFVKVVVGDRLVTRQIVNVK